MKNLKLSKIEIKAKDPLMVALKLMDSQQLKLLVVTSDNKFDGLLSIGDIQRYIIKYGHLDGLVGDAVRKNILTAKITDDLHKVKEVMLKNRTEFMPILNHHMEVVDIFFWDDLFEKNSGSYCEELSGIPVVIMAGGQGHRLRPITNIIPKPLIPLGECSVIERIIEQFYKKGARDYFATINYKAEMIKFYFTDLHVNYNIQFVEEEIPLGTAGSLSLLVDNIHSTFFISNCDILVEEDMGKILDYHRQNENQITIVASIYNHSIPYGTLITSEGGVLESIEEKPELFYQVNTGVYVFEPEILKLLQSKSFIHITDLIMMAKDHGNKVGVYPINANSWMDIGQWKEYRRTAERFGDSFE